MRSPAIVVALAMAAKANVESEIDGDTIRIGAT